MKPKVSVCMPNYNCAPYLSEAIESVLMQTYADYEFIIIDNCSSDNSHDIIRRYVQKDSRIRFYSNDRNVGMVNNFNLCLQRAQGEYIKYLLSDDVFVSPRTLEKMQDVLEADRKISLVASARNVIDEHSVVKRILCEYKGSASYVGTEIIQECLLEQKNRIGEPSVVMFRKNNAIRGFDGRYRQIVDLEMWFHLLERGDFYFIEEPLCSFRTHRNQQTHVNNAAAVLPDDIFQLLRDYGNKEYVNFSLVYQEYMRYVPVYSVWKLYKKKKLITRQEAIAKIKKHYSVQKFILLYIPFKLYRFFRKTILNT